MSQKKTGKNIALNSIQEVSTVMDYWFVRTDSGDHFDTFLENSFIGIGWNEISLHDLKHQAEAEVKFKIARITGADPATKVGKQKNTDVYNKLVKFNNLQKGDIVVIPSEGSHLLAFGQIVDDKAYTEREGANGCEYKKRRKVKWLTSAISIDRLDPIFYKVRKARHSISNINHYDYYIDSILYDIYQKNNNSHFVIRVNTTDEINLLKLSEVLKGLHEIMSIVNNDFQLGENIDTGSIRINLQSPGLFNIKQAGISLLLAASLLGSSSCNMNNQPQNTKNQLEQTYNQHKNAIDSVRNNMRDMDIDL